MSKKIEERFKKLTLRDQILIRPDTYVGSLNTENRKIYVANINENSEIYVSKENIDYNPALIKIIDEILTNASDHFIRTDGKVKYLRIKLTDNEIIIENDGSGIPVVIHKDEKLYVPEMIFGHLLTSENYDDNDERIVGGRNGYGAKLTNIFSKKFTIETCDGKKYFKQDYYDNLSTKDKPVIKRSKKEFTRISFVPDWERFGFENITYDTIKVIIKRALDISAYCPKLKVYISVDCPNKNIEIEEKLISLKSFKEYISLFKTKDDSEIFYENINSGKWEIGLLESPEGEFEQLSMVNGISTLNGGTHVNYISNQIVKYVEDFLIKKYKKSKISNLDILRNIMIFVNAQIVNPEFETQTKENLITKMTKNHVENVTISDNFLKKLSNSNIMQNIIDFIELKDKAKLKKESGKKSSKVKIRKLDDANRAGTKDSDKCLLFLTEGDSAKSTILSGFEEKDRDYYGCLSLRGKILNVRDVFDKNKIINSEEIKNIVNALGLEYGKKYEDVSELRYGKLIISVDQDPDGCHIKGLLINFFDIFWPELLKLDFIYEFITPIVKATKNNRSRYFYRIDEYRKWRDSDQSQGYFIKYYKGLGTIEEDESVKFFKNIDKHLIKFYYTDEDITRDRIDLAFRKKRSDDRKEWISNYNPTAMIDKFKHKTTYQSFIDNELIEFSMFDNVRNIPSMLDGLKPTQRKVLYTLLKKNFKNEIKVSQLTGTITDETAYHHGPVSLEETIINMAQNFTGSNNLNLLEPKGQFGTRKEGGDDHSAPRYIFTKLNDATRNIFIKEDDNILEFLNDDGKKIEPKFYLPIIPMILVNGSVGIGTAYSTNIPSFNVKDIIKYYKNRLNNKNYSFKIDPYVEGFKGKIIEIDNNKYISQGIYEIIDNKTLKIKELPVKVWTEPYHDYLDKLIEKKIIKDYERRSINKDINIIVKFDEGVLDRWIEEDTIYKNLNLENILSLNNMMLFDENAKLVKYENQYHILDEFYNLRLKYYEKRKEFILNNKEKDINILENKILFLKFVIEDKIILNKRKKDDIISQIKSFNLLEIDDSYDYLLNMKLWNLSYEKIQELSTSLKNEKNELKLIKTKSIEEMWLNDLENLKI